MTSFSWISILALVCYLFLLFVFLSAKKTKVIRSFILLLSSLLLAVGGSFLMRIQFWPSVNFWHYVSLLGILLVPGAFYAFFLDFLDEKAGNGRYFWLVFYGLLYVVNLFTDFFIPTPLVQETASGGVQFVYRYTWAVLPLLAGAVLIAVSCIRLFVRYCRGDVLVLRQLSPVLTGLLVMVAGTALSAIPAMQGFPVDILSGLIFSWLVFYALYKKRMFKLSLLATPVGCNILAAGSGFALCYVCAAPAMSYLCDRLHMCQALAVACIAAAMALFVLLLYLVMRRFLAALFVREEKNQNDILQQFSHRVAQTLVKEKILGALAETIQEIVPVEQGYVCLRGAEDAYPVEQSFSRLHSRDFMLTASHPLICYLRGREGCLLMEDFARTSIYRSMWETEKKALLEEKIACFVPIADGDELIGVVLLSQKRKGGDYTFDECTLLAAIGNVCAMAVRNSQMYEQSYFEARRDDLTGLLNRKSFYENLTKDFEENRKGSLALLMLNVDDFKLFNQLYGAEEGDRALQKIAQILTASTQGRGTAYRLNGKEFAVLLPDYDIYSAKQLAGSLMEQIHRMNDGTDTAYQRLNSLTVSCGICAAPYLAATPEELVANTDFAIYTAKRTGKNKVVIYSETIQEEQQKSGHSSGYDAYAATVYALTAAIDTKDHYTFQHSQNVANYAQALAKKIGMDDEFAEIIKEAGLLHDIGKIGIREDILNKPGKLTAEEFAIMKSHVENSVGIIRHLPSLDYVIPAVISHHERYDGRGYPRGIAGENIPLMGRILCVVDSFDAMTSKRCYKPSMPVSRALEILRQERGTQFDPQLADAFIDMVQNGEITLDDTVEAPLAASGKE